MTFQEEIADLKIRVTKAEFDREAWRTSGMQEKYLEACSLVDALELQLERMRQEGLQARPMAEFGITYDGRQYQYDRYRYDLLADAVNYAELHRSSLPPTTEAPDESRRRLMAELAITFQDGLYHLGTHRYERLADAVNYARLQLVNRARS